MLVHEADQIIMEWLLSRERRLRQLEARLSMLGEMLDNYVEENRILKERIAILMEDKAKGAHR